MFEENPNKIFQELLHDLQCAYDTKSYIIGIYNKYIYANNDFSRQSITLLYANARETHSFELYQSIGDWIFISQTLFNNNLKASKDYCDTIARLSYYNCYKLLNKQWKLYDELADSFIDLENQASEKLKPIKLGRLY